MSDAMKTFEKVVRLVASKDRKIKRLQAEITRLEEKVQRFYNGTCQAKAEKGE